MMESRTLGREAPTRVTCAKGSVWVWWSIAISDFYITFKIFTMKIDYILSR